jgi:hypothetical protein
MGGPKYIATMPEWMSDVYRRIEKLERRKHHRAYVRNAGGALVARLPENDPPPQVVTLAIGTVLRDNDDGTFTVVAAPPLTEYEEL